MEKVKEKSEQMPPIKKEMVIAIKGLKKSFGTKDV